MINRNALLAILHGSVLNQIDAIIYLTLKFNDYVTVTRVICLNLRMSLPRGC